MIEVNIKAVRERINRAARKYGQDPGGITLVCVTKEVDLPQIKEVIECGITDIGESRVGDALYKYEEIKKFFPFSSPFATVKWHMIGHLQRNKAKWAVRIFDLIHSVDSLRLAEEIDKQAGRIDRAIDILIQVNTSGEESKFGCSPEETFSLVKEIRQLSNLRLRGFMAIAPLVKDPEECRPYFRKLRLLKEEIEKCLLSTLNSQLSTDFKYLSMGMTQDFEVAIEEGANMVRIGSAIFK